MPSAPNRVIVQVVMCALFFVFKAYANEKHRADETSWHNFEISNDTLSNPKDLKFDTKYNALITRAYFKIIVEAEKVDLKLSEEFRNKYKECQNNVWNAEREQELEAIYRKFTAHRRMLKGLKSWRIFSDYRTGDLAYFKTENFNQIYAMYKRGSNDYTMVKVLMYKLADLYHFGE